jgi:integrase
MARERAGAAKDNVASGVDPGAAKKAVKAAPAPVDDLVERVVTQFISVHAKRQLKASTAHEVERLLMREVAGPWRGRRLAEIKRPDVHALLDAVVNRGAPSCQPHVGMLRSMCSWAVERGIIETSPCTGIKAPAAETSRERVLLDDELVAIWRSAEFLEQPYGAFVMLLSLAPGETKSPECAGKKLASRKTWTLPRERVKNGRKHTIPLADGAVEILKACPRIAGSDFVFTISGRGPIRDFASIKKRVDTEMPEMPSWVLRDLRRSFASGCARLGVAVHVVEAALNHKSGSIRGIAAIYNRYSYDAEKRLAFDAWARHVEGLIGETVPMLRA